MSTKGWCLRYECHCGSVMVISPEEPVNLPVMTWHSLRVSVMVIFPEEPVNMPAPTLFENVDKRPSNVEQFVFGKQST